MSDEDLFKNFAMMIPKTAIYQLHGYPIFGATGQEFIDFKEWFKEQCFKQLHLPVSETKVDIWIRYSDMIIDHVGYSIQGWFEYWKKNPPSKEPFTMTTHKYPKE